MPRGVFNCYTKKDNSYQKLMNDTTFMPRETIPWNTLPLACCMLTPFVVWSLQSGCSAYVCLLPLGQLVTIKHYATFAGDWKLSFYLHKKGTEPYQAVEAARGMLQTLADRRKLGAPNRSTARLGNTVLLDTPAFETEWRAWCTGGTRPGAPELEEPVDMFESAMLAARLLAKQGFQAQASACSERLGQAMESGRIQALVDAEPFIATLLGNLCDAQPEGALDFARLLKAGVTDPTITRTNHGLARALCSNEGRLLGDVLEGLMRQLPSGELRAMQQVLDKFFRSNPGLEARQQACGEDEEYSGPLPMRLSLNQMLCQLVPEETLAEFFNWAESAGIPA